MRDETIIIDPDRVYTPARIASAHQPPSSI